MIYEMSLCQAVYKACINNINLCFREIKSKGTFHASISMALSAPKEKRLRIKYSNLRRTIKKNLVKAQQLRG